MQKAKITRVGYALLNETGGWTIGAWGIEGSDYPDLMCNQTDPNGPLLGGWSFIELWAKRLDANGGSFYGGE